jgi:hypothetical protein
MTTNAPKRYIGDIAMANNTTGNTVMQDYCREIGLIDNSPFSSVRLFKVFHPRPILYSFDHIGLICFVWADEFDRKHGRYESNKRRAISKCDSLRLNDSQREAAWFTEEGYLSINVRGLSQILQFHAATKPDNSFGTDDLKLFFEQSTNGFNDAEQLIENYANQAAILWPEKLRRT